MVTLHPLLQQTLTQQPVKKIVPETMYRLFATPVFKSKITDIGLIDHLAKSLYKIKEKGEGFPSPNSWCTRDDLQTLPEFRELCDIILDEVNKILDTLSIVREDHYISCMWANISQVGTAHIEHFHPNSFYSGVLYIQIPPGSGKLFFTDPRTGPQMMQPSYSKPSPDLMGTDFSVAPEKGVMYVFPSWLPHGVDVSEHQPDSPERISLSFNIMLKAKIELPTARWHLK
jgi:uncharacterized protein (TIGR02466 family)